MKITRILLVMSLALSCLTPLTVTQANVPTVMSIEEATRGDDDVLVIEVSHSSPSSSHYIDMVEVEVGEQVFTMEDLGGQSTAVFTVEHVLESSGTGVRVRAHCNLHGWSQWTQLGDEQTDQGGGIPGFGYAAMFLGLALYFMVARVRARS